MRCAVVLVALLGCTDTGVGMETQAIVGGASSPQDRATVALVSDRGVFCSGVLIDPRHVLTAAHCLPPHISEPIEDVDVFFGVDITQGGTRIGIAAARAHPAWRPDSFTDDIGIVDLVEPSTIEPATIASAGLLLEGDTLRAVGYGVSQSAGTPGIKRAGSLIVNSVDAWTIRLFADHAVTCNGDSGGPLFATTDAGEVVVGINSRSNCETAALAERIDVHVDFMAGRDDVHDDDVIGGCSSTRAPRSWMLVVLIVAARRRRRGGVQ